MKKFLFLPLLIFIFSYVFAVPTLYINEFFYDAPGTDTSCYIEIKGIPGTSLDSVKIVGINGNGGAVFATINLSGKTIPADSYFVVAQSANVPNYDMISTLVDFQNGPSDNIILRFDSLGSYTTLDAVCYGLPSGADSVFRGETWPTYDVAPATNYFAYMGRHTDPFTFEFNNNYLDFAHYMVRTPGSANNPLLLKSIVDIQTTPDSFSLYKDSTVKVIDTCVVTAVFTGQYYITSKTGPKEWDGICVYGDIGNHTYNVGDTIIFYHGLVNEYFNKTQLVSVGTELYKAGDGTSPAPFVLSLSQIGENYEGVLIKVGPVAVLTAPDANGEWLVSDGVDTLTIDNLATYTVPSIGQTVYITGILDYTYGNYKLQPRNNSDIEIVNLFNISGVVTLDDNSNSSGISVILYNNNFNDTIVTDSVGSFDFGPITEGTYNLIFKKTYYETDSSEIVLQSDTIINKTLLRLKGTISGYVDLSDSPSDLSNSIVTIYYDVVTVDTTDATGYYSFSNLPLGKSYKLKFEHNGYAPDSITFTLEDTSYTCSVNLTKLTGLDENLKVEKIVVEDNGNGIFSFIYNKEVDNPTNIMIYDLTGRNVVNKPVESGKGVYKITLSKKLSKGVYFIQITGEERPFVKKFVVVN
ncbi:MAG: T9SS type A sorting domain-containing protein [candidate division WOR-3 bacterium]